MSDPYKPPSPEEVEESGTADWVDGALEVHERKQRRLSSLLDSDREALRRQREAVQQAWSGSAKGPDLTAGPAQPPAPDVFAQERAKNSERQARLSSVFDDDLKGKAEQDDHLRNFFGGGGSSQSGSKSGPKKPRR